MITTTHENVKLNDLPYWLDAHRLVITSTRIVGELEGQLWIEAETRSTTARTSDVVTTTPSDASSQPHQSRQGGQP